MHLDLVQSRSKMRDQVKQQEADLLDLSQMLHDIRCQLGAEFSKRSQELENEILIRAAEVGKDKWSIRQTNGSVSTTQATDRIADADQELVMQEMEKQLGMEYEVHTLLSISSDDLPSSPTACQQ